MSTEPLALDIKSATRGLLDVAKVASGPEQPSPPDAELGDLLVRLLDLVEKTMPPDLQAQDARVLTARVVADLFVR